MSDDEPLADVADELFELAPCGYLATRPDGTIVKVNRTFAGWTGRPVDELLAGVRFQELLDRGGRIYHETHVAPLLHMQGSVREIALDVLRADGTALPTLVNAALHRDADGRPREVRIAVFDATDRRRYEQELLGARRRDQEIARELQRSLLSGELPVADGLELDVAYRPAVSGTEAGGDWYDAFWIDEGAVVALVVGDVVGRGIEAAATMGQLRSAVRALASTGLGPAAVVGALDAFAGRHAIGRMTTLVYAQVTLATGELRYVCAGHPPPVLAAPGAPPALAWEGRSLPLDAYVPRARAEACVHLQAGTTLVLYTDGLIERRARSLGEGLDRLRDAVAAGADAERPAPAIVAAALDDLDGEHADDMCVLVARVRRAGMRASPSTTP